VIYEMLAGEPPYTGPTAQAIIAKRLSEPVPHLVTVRAVPKPVELAVTRALAKAPADRFPSVSKFAAELERTEPTERAAVRPRMSRRMAALVGGTATLGVVLLLAWLLRPGTAAPPAVSRQVTFTGRANDPALSPDGRSVVYVSANQSLTVQRLDGGDPLVLVPPSRWVFNPRWTRDGTAILFSMMPDSTRLAATWMIPSVGGAPHEVIQDIDAFDAGPDSTTALVSQREKHRIVLMDLRNQQVRDSLRIPDSLGVVNDLDWSPDQRWIAFEAQGIWIASMHSTPVRLSSTGRLPQWSPAGDAVYFLDGPRGSRALKRVRVDARGGKPRGSPTPVLGLPTADRFAVGPGAVLVHTQVALSSQAVALRYGGRAARRVEEQRSLTEGTGVLNGLTISEDGRQVAVSRGQGEESSIIVVPFEGGPGRVVAGSPLEELAPTWSPDGTKLAFLRADSAATRLMTVAFPDGTPRRLGSAEPVSGSFTTGLSWSGDGSRLSYRASDLRRIGVIDVDRQQESFVTIPDSLGYGYSGGGFLSPDGRQLVISTIHRWNDWGELWLASTDGRILRRVSEPLGESYPVRWTRDGWLYVVNTRATFTDVGYPQIFLWRIRMPDGAPEFVAPIPEGCGAFSLSADATRAVCDFNTRQSDLVAVTGFDPEARP
jgi:Tol biopolymer transport system component